MTPRYRLLAVRVDGEFRPAILDERDPSAIPLIWERDRPGYAELLRLMAATNDVPGSLGLGLQAVAALPHYLSDEKVAEIRAMARRAEQDA